MQILRQNFCTKSTSAYLVMFSLSAFFYTGHSLSDEVVQVPSSHLGSPRDSATLTCSHSITSYNVILWYQQLVGDTNLKLIGYTLYQAPTLEDPFKGHFNVTGDGSKQAYLHILKLRKLEDSGMYYCAASRHSD